MQKHRLSPPRLASFPGPRSSGRPRQAPGPRRSWRRQHSQHVQQKRHVDYSKSIGAEHLFAMADRTLSLSATTTHPRRDGPNTLQMIMREACSVGAKQSFDGHSMQAR